VYFLDEAPGVRSSRARQDFEWDAPLASRLFFKSSTAVKAHHAHEQTELAAFRANRAWHGLGESPAAGHVTSLAVILR